MREEVLFALNVNKDMIHEDNGQFYYCHIDHGRAEFKLAHDDKISSSDVIDRSALKPWPSRLFFHYLKMNLLMKSL